MCLGFSRNLIVKSASVGLAIGLFVATSFPQRPKVLAPHQPIAPRVPKGKELPLPPAKLALLSAAHGWWMRISNPRFTLRTW